MATYTNQILVYVGGRNQKITAADALVIGGSFTAASFSGDGSALTALNASNISSGTLADARLSSNVALYDAAAPNFTNTVTAAGFSGSGAGLTSLDASSLSTGTVADARLSANVAFLNAVSNTFTGSISASSFSGDGSSLTSLNGSNISSGTVADARLSSNVTKYDDAAPNFTNGITAPSFSGSGASLTNLDASNVSSGTLGDSYLSSNVAKYNDVTPTFDGTVSAAGFSTSGAVSASTLSGDGSAVTNLDASNISAGTIGDAYLSANVALLNAASNSFSGDMSIGGDLVVTGDIVSKGATSVVIGDNFLDLNAGNTVTASASAGGLSVSVQAVGTVFTDAATDFTPGVAATSNPYITLNTDPTADFAPGDLIQVSGSTDGKNDGQYVVLSVSASPNRITVEGVGTIGVQAYLPFAHTQFVAQTGETATVTKAIFSVIAASNGSLTDASANTIPAGRWAQCKGSTYLEFDGAWIPLDPNAAVSLQSAYNNGASIDMTAATGPFEVNAASGETVGFSINGTAASNVFTTDRLTLSADGDVEIQSNVGKTRVFNDLWIPNTTTVTGASLGGLTSGAIVAFGAAGGLVAASASTAGVVPAGAVADANRIYPPFVELYALADAGTWSPGDTLYLSTNAGRVTATPPTSGRVYIVGVATEPYSSVTPSSAGMRLAFQYVADL